MPDLHPTNGPVHGWFGLTYTNYQVLHRTLMQSMPTAWQERMVACLEELRAAYDHVDLPEAFKVQAATDHIVNEMTESQLYAAGILVEGDGPDGPGPGTRYHSTEDGREVDPHERALIPVTDPVPHYNRGRTYIEPRLPEREKDTSDGRQPSAGESTPGLADLLRYAEAFEIPRPGNTVPLLLERSYAGGDRWSIGDREGRRWDREHGFVFERQDLDERTRTDTRFPLTEAWILAHRLAAGEPGAPAAEPPEVSQ
ncbi:hypothetical protein AB0D27_11330 [Streptomyces sp. NPDC048415]|uniref:hypothetical protein n=1 Tax=Streptomyces sp. NPDC048415 TaxID=3154822 RepID=UPI0034352E5E